MDTEAPETGGSIREIAMKIPGVEDVEKVIARQSVSRSHAIAHEVKDAVMRSMPRVLDVLVHIEPHERRE